MNKENEQTIISGDKNSNTQSSHYNNSDEILIQERLIENMERRIQELERVSKSYHISKHYLPIASLITAFISIIIAPIMSSLLTDMNTFTTFVDTIYGTVSMAMALSISLSICIIPVGIGTDFLMYRDYKSNVKEKNEIDKSLDFLTKQIKKEKTTLERLKQEKAKDNENTKSRQIEVDVLQQLRNSLHQDICFSLSNINEKSNYCHKEIEEKNSLPLSRKKKKIK